jgi:large repetitive protein
MFLNAVVLQEYDGGQLIRPVDMMTEINAPGFINLSWSDRSNIETGYEIWRATSGTAFSLLATTAANVGTFTDNTAQKNIRYYYKVRAMNGTTPSEFSNVANKLLGSNLILMNLSAASVSSQAAPWNNGRVVPLGATTFNNLINSSSVNTGVSLRIENDWGGNFDLGMTGTGVLPSNVMKGSWWVEGGGPTGTIRLSNLHATKRYRIGIMGSSSWVGDFTASYTIGDKVVYLNAYQNSTKVVYIDDVQANNLGQIFITMGTLPGARWGFWSAITIESYDDDSNAPGPLNTTGTVQVSEDQVLLEASSPTENRSTFVQEPKVTVTEVKVFPNPFNESLTIKVSTESSKKVSVRLVDVTGRTIVTRELGVVDGIRNLTFTSSEIGKVSAGTYMLQMVTDGKVEKSVKLIKTK